MRLLVPEILDRLSPEDPLALKSRRDLILINRIMRQSTIMAEALLSFPAPRLWVDLGGGDGRLLLRTARVLARRWAGVTLAIADRIDIVSDQTRADFAALGWDCHTLTGDVLNTLPGVSPDLVTANLFLHHLDGKELVSLLALAARAHGFVACEPQRTPIAFVAARLIGLLGVSAVTRHDALASVRAGFCGHELSQLWPQSPGWQLCERAIFPFTHLFCAHAL